MNTIQLIDELATVTQNNIKEANFFLDLNEDQLNYRTSENSWTILECIEHLNEYADYYVNEMYRKIESSTTKPSEKFSPGILGNYFSNAMLPGKNMKMMKSPQDMNPIRKKLNKSAIEKFLNYQEQTLKILEKSKSVNLEKIKIPITIAKFIKLKLGDTLRFNIYHNKRHILQAKRILE